MIWEQDHLSMYELLFIYLRERFQMKCDVSKRFLEKGPVGPALSTRVTRGTLRRRDSDLISQFGGKWIFVLLSFENRKRGRSMTVQHSTLE